ncbi:MAG: M23 family metallopeptidase [Treponema sp.]|uniref:M23 family metallopeptidase n=1 Tax=Treponema sp. TaxID=166 RepID=UPI0025EB1263|nr:M23 family metallopeptidase [Treponema sp.]MBR0495269.1 M23 family metallopeptidase [Treponema sp.]
MKKLIFGICASLIIPALCVPALFAFDWPQNEILSDSFFSYFGQLRGGTIGTSLVFSESREVKAADDGKVLAIISEHDEDELFESTLGNAAILAHKDDLITVYANLDSQDLDSLYKMSDVKSGTVFGGIGSSGWQQGEGCLEFQVLDTKNRTYINPRILMPRIGKELQLTIKDVKAISKKGVSYDLGTVKTMPSGVYQLYRERQEIAMPYKTTVYINGAVAEALSYDTLSEKNGKISVTGKKNYDVKVMYPDKESQFLGEVTITKGKNSIMVVASDILGKEKQILYTIEAR